MSAAGPLHWVRKGSLVYVLNCTIVGKFFVEGHAEVLRRLGDDRFLVRFPDGSEVERFVDNAAQDDPDRYVRLLNQKVEEANARLGLGAPHP